jgi:hypothetical protein
MLGLTDKMTVDEIKAEIKRYQETLDGVMHHKKKYDQNYEFFTSNISGLNKMLSQREHADRVKNFKLSNDHIKLLKNMEFEYYPDGGHYVFIGVEGKRPFGNSNIFGDVADILGLSYEYDLSEEQETFINNIIEELPIAINHIFEKFKLLS